MSKRADKKGNNQASNTYVYMYQINHFILLERILKKKGLMKHWNSQFLIQTTDNIKHLWCYWGQYDDLDTREVQYSQWPRHGGYCTWLLSPYFFPQSKSQSYVSFQNNIYYKSTTTKFKMDAPLDEIKFLSKIEIGQKKNHFKDWNSEQKH